VNGKDSAKSNRAEGPEAKRPEAEKAAVGEKDGSDRQKLVKDLLENKNIKFQDKAAKDLRDRQIDPRVMSLLMKISQSHSIEVSCFITGHPKHANNDPKAKISDHIPGRAADITSVDGVRVSHDNVAAKALVQELIDVRGPLAGMTIDHPWPELTGNIKKGSTYIGVHHGRKDHDGNVSISDPTHRGETKSSPPHIHVGYHLSGPSQ